MIEYVLGFAFNENKENEHNFIENLIWLIPMALDKHINKIIVCY